MLCGFAILCCVLCLVRAIDPTWLNVEGAMGECKYNSDCRANNARCIDSYCHCLSTAVNIDGKCLPKIKPGQSPCIADAQCQSVWPDTRCVNTICQCTRGVHVRTRDGIVCVEYESCPLGGKASPLRHRNGTLAECHISKTGLMFGCLDQLHMYDCIRDKKQNGNFYCCPNKANACSQPLDPGQRPTVYPAYAEPLTTTEPTRFLPWYLRTRARRPQRTVPDLSSERWHYDRFSDKCTPFIYMGERGNANNFKNRQHCENYCKSTCAMGNPMFQTGPNGDRNQFSQRQQLCNVNTGCGNPNFACEILQPGTAMCCPNRGFICGVFGGIPHRSSSKPYDEGVFCEETHYTITRYYFDKDKRACHQFQYKGCSGNFNKFQSLQQCRDFCMDEGNVYQNNTEKSQNAYFRFGWSPT